MWEWHNAMNWGVSFGWFWMLLFWSVIIGLTIWVVKKLTESKTSHTDTTVSNKPLDIARERYAMGEISKEEFDQIKKDVIN